MRRSPSPEARLSGYRHSANAARNLKEVKIPGTRGSAMALVQYPQITRSGLGNAPRPLLFFDERDEQVGPVCGRLLAQPDSLQRVTGRSARIHSV